MNNANVDIKWYAAIGIACGAIVYAIDAMFRVCMAELKFEEAQRDAMTYRQRYYERCMSVTELQAMIHELKWELATNKEES